MRADSDKGLITKRNEGRPPQTSGSPIWCAQSRLGKHAGSCADRLVLYARGSAGGRSSSRQNRVLGRHISSVESWGWTPDVPVRSSGLRQRACRAELVALWGLHDGPGARVLEGIRVRAGPRASAFAVASANRPGGHPAATSTSAFRQIVVTSPVRCRAAVAVACDRRGARMVPLAARLTLLLNPGSLANWRLKWWNGFPERPDGLFRHRCMAQGGAFRFQGCGTVTCSSRSRLAPDSSRRPARVILAGSTPTSNAVVPAMSSSRSSILSWPRWRRTRPGPRPRPRQRAESPGLTLRQGRIGCCLRG